MKSTFLFIILFSLVNIASAQKMNYELEDIKELKSFIPIISYNPVKFNNHVLKSFIFNPKCEYLFKFKGNGKLNLYWYSDYPSNQGKYTLNKITTPLPLTFKKIINEKDSVFIFYPNINKYNASYDFIPQSIKYLGYLENGKIHYVNCKNESLTIEQLIINEFGSLNNFREKYIEQINDALYSSGSGLYEFDNSTLAERYLKSNYKFNYMINRCNKYEDIIQMFIDWLKKTLILNTFQEKKIYTILYASNKTDINVMVNDFLSGRKIHEPFNIECLKEIFSIDEFQIIQTHIKEDNIKIMNSYSILRDQISNIDTSGYYYTDNDVLKIISRELFENK